MERINVKYERFRDIVLNTNTAINSEFKDLRKGTLGKIDACISSTRPVPRAHMNILYKTHLIRYLSNISFKLVGCLLFLSLATGLVKDIRTIDRQIKDLKGAVDMVSSHVDAHNVM